MSVEETVEDLVDLVCGELLSRSTNEPIRRAAQDLLVRDHGRRLARDGKHPITGETFAEYVDRATKSGGKHPQTGETLEEIKASPWGKSDTKPVVKG